MVSGRAQPLSCSVIQANDLRSQTLDGCELLPLRAPASQHPRALSARVRALHAPLFEPQWYPRHPAYLDPAAPPSASFLLRGLLAFLVLLLSALFSPLIKKSKLFLRSPKLLSVALVLLRLAFRHAALSSNSKLSGDICKLSVIHISASPCAHASRPAALLLVPFRLS